MFPFPAYLSRTEPPLITDAFAKGFPVPLLHEMNLGFADRPRPFLADPLAFHQFAHEPFERLYELLSVAMNLLLASGALNLFRTVFYPPNEHLTRIAGSEIARLKASHLRGFESFRAPKPLAGNDFRSWRVLPDRLPQTAGKLQVGQSSFLPPVVQMQLNDIGRKTVLG
ncbi:MAG: hypothetical protein UCO86_12845, partial [Eggerthella lenta]|nr:hypothetical protein [Eggerthella lenta]